MSQDIWNDDIKISKAINEKYKSLVNLLVTFTFFLICKIEVIHKSILTNNKKNHLLTFQIYNI